jgi:hypothetical protein
VQQLSTRALSQLEELATLAEQTNAQLGAWIRTRYQAECSAVAALDCV